MAANGKPFRRERCLRREKALRLAATEKFAAERERADPIEIGSSEARLFFQFAKDVAFEEFTVIAPNCVTRRRAVEARGIDVLSRRAARQIGPAVQCENHDCRA